MATPTPPAPGAASGGSKKTIIYIVVAAVVLILAFNGCSTYNSLVSESETVDQAWAAVQNQYQRRYDLIPNLVETVKGYAAHESGTFEKVTAARAGLDTALNNAKGMEGGDLNSEQNFQEYAKAQAQLKQAYGLYINAVHEAYPDLKANENFKDLQVQLEGTENRIATERHTYTQVVQQYNVKVQQLPTKLWASLFGFSKKPQFAADEEAQKAVKVSFD